MRVERHADVCAVLTAPGFAVPPVPDTGESGGIRWLRATVPRFCSGATHRRRRALSTTALAGVDAPALRVRSAEWATTALDQSDGQPFDLMAQLARTVPVELLGAALGLEPGLADTVTTVAEAYHPHVDAGPAADRAVASLVERCGGVADERSAAMIGLLVQAADATAGLIGNAAVATMRFPSQAPVEAILTETLRHDPPVRATRRVATEPTQVSGNAVAPGTVVELDLAMANRDTAVFADAGRFDPARADGDLHVSFGVGPRACPGQAHALAIAAGIVDAVSGCRLRTSHITYAPSGYLRVPTTLMVTAS